VENALLMLTDRFDDALAYASRIHREQIRKGSGVPYISHLLGVASLALEAGADEDQAIAALLHDAVEDQGGTERLADIRARYGDRVAEMVDHCTDSYVEPKPEWRPRKEAYIAAMAHKPRQALLVSLADKTHNISAILTDLLQEGPSVWERFTGKKDGTLWYYRALAQSFQTHLPGPSADRFAGIVAEVHLRAE
jgi:(p)ppGpp synthase/HD superfamily hydrolase